MRSTRSVYTVESASHKGVRVIGEYTSKVDAVKVMHTQQRTSVVRNSSGRIVATSLTRSF